MTGKALITSHFLRIFEKTTQNQVLQLNQDNVNITFENYLNTLNTSVNSCAPLKKLNKKLKKVSTKNYGLQKESTIQLKRKIDSLKSTLNELIVIKIFCIKNIKHKEIAYQFY